MFLNALDSEAKTVHLFLPRTVGESSSGDTLDEREVAQNSLAYRVTLEMAAVPAFGEKLRRGCRGLVATGFRLFYLRNVKLRSWSCTALA